MAITEDFRVKYVTKIFTDKSSVIDIGGGLRYVPGGDRYNPSQEWLRGLMKGVDYKIMNPVADYGADIIGDIHQMPFPDNSLEAIICTSVLEHVENPIKAADEMYRSLKPGGYCYIFVPFLFYYHLPESGLYKDYWRFTEDGVRYIFRNFSSIEISSAAGAIETWLQLNPATQKLKPVGKWLDELLGKSETKQTRGYSAFLVK